MKFDYDRTKISECSMVKYHDAFIWIYQPDNVFGMIFYLVNLELIENILSARLPNESIRGILNIMAANEYGASIDQIQTALVSYICGKNKTLTYFFNDINVNYFTFRNICTVLCPFSNVHSIFFFGIVLESSFFVAVRTE